MELVKERNILIGLTASLAVVAFGLSWYIAALSDPAWTFGANYLSDLGVSDNEMSRLFFNGGCILAGILLAVTGTAVLTSMKGRLYKAAGLCTMIAGIAMAFVGVFTEDAGSLHFYIACVAFGMGFLALIFVAVKDRMNGLRALSALTVLGVFLVLVSYLWLVQFEDNSTFLLGAPGVETVMALVLFALFLLQGMKFLYHGGLETEVKGKGMCDRHMVAFGFIALFAAVSFLLFMGFAILSDLGWVFGTDPVYMLGLSDVSDTQMFFVIACVVGGLFTLLYGIGAGMMHNGQARSVSGFFIVLMGVSLYLLGLAFLLAPGLINEYVEYCIVTMGVLAILCIAISDWMFKRMTTAAYYFLVALFSALLMLFIGYEMASAVAIALFFTIVGIEGVKLMRSG
ncbi:MAG: DUF998 domain-containing protein [Methanomassiliicoccaceae archaeon]|jgi:hypothetical membrane protein|nr:DUF998 domain-containing protein [Methanomassiliicoccaceae archaeon]